MERCYYVYLIFRPNWIPCYVGKGRGRRWLFHFRKCINPHLAAIIKNAGGNLPIIKLNENLTNRQAGKLEKQYISLIGREMNGGPLVNQTDGGDGVVGRSPEGCARISVANRGRKLTDAHKAAIGASSTGRFYSAETREKLAAGQRGRKRPAWVLAKMSAITKERIARDGNPFKGKHHSEESKAKMRAAKLGKPSPKKGKPSPIAGLPLSLSHRLAIKQSWEKRRMTFGQNGRRL